jgi:branched-chain amino acid transport system permease protein
VKGIYLAVATLAAHFILTFVFREWEPVTGGVPGTTIPRAKPVWLRVHRRPAQFLPDLHRGLRSPPSRRATWAARTSAAPSWPCVRRISAPNCWVSTCCAPSCWPFALGAFYAGVAGGLLGYFYGAITPEYFVLTLSVFYLAAIIVGGLGTVLGSVLGALFMTFVPEVLRLVAHASSQWFPGVAGLLLPMGQVVFGVLIIGFLVFEPHGLAAIWARVRRTFHLWPFKT